MSGNPDIDRVAKSLGHHFDDSTLIEAALTHPSVAGAPTYQRLEFLGDRVLGLIIADWLYRRFPDEPEGDLNRRLSALVRRETLAAIGESLDLPSFIRIDPSAEAKGAVTTPAVVADVCEAVIGAVYLDGGLEAAAEFIHRHWRARMEAGPSVYMDAKTALQEWAQARGLPLPDYETRARSGPDHDPSFEVEATVRGAGSACGTGASKRSAEQAAAAALLARLGKRSTS